jgi:hypothetical protein
MLGCFSCLTTTKKPTNQSSFSPINSKQINAVQAISKPLEALSKQDSRSIDKNIRSKSIINQIKESSSENFSQAKDEQGKNSKSKTPATDLLLLNKKPSFENTNTGKASTVEASFKFNSKQVAEDPNMCLFCEGVNCKSEDYAFAINSPIEGLNCNLVFNQIFASQRPSTCLIQKYNLIQRFKEYLFDKDLISD